MRHKKSMTKIILFVLIVVLLLIGVGFFSQPVWKDWNNYDTIHGFYEEPENTIETIFLGASIVANGIIPMELYENYGLCTYNLGTEQQPMLASYYWLEEAYRLHKKCLKTVVLDVSMLRRSPDEAFYRKAIDSMRYSSVKYRAVKDYTNGSLNEILSYLVPLFAYHDRWSSLVEADFEKGGYEACTYTRGYNFETQIYLNSKDTEELGVPEYYYEENDEKLELEEESLYYLKKMIDFCQEKGLKLILMKTPVIESWSSSAHNSVQIIAEEYGLDFLDFNYVPYIDLMSYNHALDSADGGHMNYFGASKLTNWFGEYLSSQCEGTDVRGDERYDFLETELSEYYMNIKNTIMLRMEMDPASYIQKAKEIENCVIFLVVKDEASKELTQEQRDVFESIGLTKMAELSFRASYLAVIEDGGVVEEQIQPWRQNGDSGQKSEIGDIETKHDLEIALLSKDKGSEEEKTGISATGILKDNSTYKLISNGFSSENVASCEIDGVEYLQNERGINIVVYNYETRRVVDSTVFDTYESCFRYTDLEKSLNGELAQGVQYIQLDESLLKLYLYNRRCDNSRLSANVELTVKEDGLWDFLTAYNGIEDYVIFISAMDDAAGALDENARIQFQEIGLEKLCSLEYRDSYIAIIDGGEVLVEERDHGQEPISEKGLNYKIASGGWGAGGVSSIIIDGIEYSKQSRGLNIVVYDRELETVIDQAVFDTCEVPVIMKKED